MGKRSDVTRSAFAPGRWVRVRGDGASGHVRTPSYVRGKNGRIVKCHGSFRNPEERAYFRDGLPRKRLYLVAFETKELWGKIVEVKNDCVFVDIYEHWLEEVE